MTAVQLAAYRFGTYAELRLRGEDQQCAALRVDVSPRTARRYEQALRRAQQEAGSRKQVMITLDTGPHATTARSRHGTRARYLKGCRCPACARAHYAYGTRRQQAIVRGDWQPWTAAGPARKHAAALVAAGLTVTNIARLAGVAPGTVCRLLGYDGPPSRHLRPEAAAAILAVRADLPSVPRGMVDAAGTRRRIQALVAAGWTQSALAAELGCKPVNLSAMLRGVRGQGTVRAATASAVRRLYDRLWNQPPPEGTPRAAADARAARRRARDHGWAPPMAWDDDRIDDPSAGPAQCWDREKRDQRNAERRVGSGREVAA